MFVGAVEGNTFLVRNECAVAKRCSVVAWGVTTCSARINKGHIAACLQLMGLYMTEAGLLHVQFVFLIIHSFDWIGVWVVKCWESHTTLSILVRSLCRRFIFDFLVAFLITFLVGTVVHSIFDLSATKTTDVFLPFLSTILVIIIIILKQYSRDIFVLAFVNFVVFGRFV